MASISPSHHPPSHLHLCNSLYQPWTTQCSQTKLTLSPKITSYMTTLYKKNKTCKRMNTKCITKILYNGWEYEERRERSASNFPFAPLAKISKENNNHYFSLHFLGYYSFFMYLIQCVRGNHDHAYCGNGYFVKKKW